MADAKITALTEDTSPISTDLLLEVDDPAGTPLSKKVTMANAITKAHGLSNGVISIDSGAMTSTGEGTAAQVLTSNGAGTAATFQAAAASGQTLYGAIVAASGGDYTTLTAALDGGETRIFVRNGTYAEATDAATLSSNTIIRGESMYGVVIDLDGLTSKSIPFTAGTVTNVELSNFSIKSTTSTDYLIDSGSTSGDRLQGFRMIDVSFLDGGLRTGDVGSPSEDIYIEGCEFVGGTTNQVKIEQDTTAANPQGYFILKNCWFSGSSASGLSIGGEWDYGVIEGNIFDGGSGGDGFSGTAAAWEKGCSITGNVFTGWTGGSAINAMNTAGVSYISVANNTIFNCLFGVQANSGTAISITGNTIDCNSISSSRGITCTMDDGVITGNNILNAVTGIKISGNRAQISGNRFEGNTANLSDQAVDTNIASGQFGLFPVEVQELITMTNESGAQVVAGDLVTFKAAAAGTDFTTSATGGDELVYGMAVETIANTADGLVQVLGKTTALKVNGTVDIVIGDYISTFTTVGIGKKALPGEMAIAIALEAYATDDSSGVIDALLISPRRTNAQKDIQVVPFDFTAATATGDGKFYFHVPSDMDGMNLVYVHAEVITAGTTGTTDIQIANVTGAVDMLSTKLTIDSGETGSDTAATPAVINASNDNVSVNDVLRVDVDAVSTTPANGLLVTMGFQTP